MERQFREQVTRHEEELAALQKRRENAESIIQDSIASYKREQAILDEILFYSAGTEAENEARYQLENSYQEEERYKRAFEDGKEELNLLVKDQQKAMNETEEAWANWKIEQAREKDHAQN